MIHRHFARQHPAATALGSDQHRTAPAAPRRLLTPAPADTPSAIAVRDLSRAYPNGYRAVRDLTFEVRRGEVYGFLGPNGSGKSTTVKVLATLSTPSSGSVHVAGFDVVTQKLRVRQRIGYAAQFVGIDDDLTARENLLLQARLHGLGPQDAERRAVELITGFRLEDVRNLPIRAASGGFRRRLDLAQAVVHRPEVLFLDEPTTGLDPQSRNALWDYLEELNRGGTTIFLTTQYLEEADRLCHRIGIIDHGRMLIEGSPADLKRTQARERVTLTLTRPSLWTTLRRHGAAPEISAAATRVRRMRGVECVEVVDSTLTVTVPDSAAAAPRLVEEVETIGLGVATISTDRASLDDVFLRLTGRSVRDEDATPRAPKSSVFATIHGRTRR
ncbi:MAG: ATP-binding cassette domain-containing protein [Dermatophilaceae bacterium]